MKDEQKLAGVLNEPTLSKLWTWLKRKSVLCPSFFLFLCHKVKNNINLNDPSIFYRLFDIDNNYVHFVNTNHLMYTINLACYFVSFYTFKIDMYYLKFSFLQKVPRS